MRRVGSGYGIPTGTLTKSVKESGVSSVDFCVYTSKTIFASTVSTGTLERGTTVNLFLSHYTLLRGPFPNYDRIVYLPTSSTSVPWEVK